MDINILWWHWLVFGMILIAAELAAPGGFYIIFFGVAAVIVGLMASVGSAGPLWMQLALFSVLSVGSLWLFRSRLLASFQKDEEGPPVDTLVGQVCRSVEEIAVGATGQVELRGTAWSAQNTSDAVIRRDAQCRVVRVHGLRLDVEPAGR